MPQSALKLEHSSPCRATSHVTCDPLESRLSVVGITVNCTPARGAPLRRRNGRDDRLLSTPRCHPWVGKRTRRRRFAMRQRSVRGAVRQYSRGWAHEMTFLLAVHTHADAHTQPAQCLSSQYWSALCRARPSAMRRRRRPSNHIRCALWCCRERDTLVVLPHPACYGHVRPTTDAFAATISSCNRRCGRL